MARLSKNPKYFLALIAAAIVFIALLAITVEISPKVEQGAGPSDNLTIVMTEGFSVYDGDTFHAYIDGVDERVRVTGVDTPEMASENASERAAAEQAKDYTKSLVDGKEVWLVMEAGHERDRYGRILAYVWLCEPPTTLEGMRAAVLDDTLNGQLLMSGHADVMSIEPNTTFVHEFESVVN